MFVVPTFSSDSNGSLLVLPISLLSLFKTGSDGGSSLCSPFSMVKFSSIGLELSLGGSLFFRSECSSWAIKLSV